MSVPDSHDPKDGGLKVASVVWFLLRVPHNEPLDAT